MKCSFVTIIQHFVSVHTLHARIADFKEHLQVTEARFGALEVGVRNANLTSFTSGALGVEWTDDVSGTSKEAFVLTDGSLLSLDTLADTMTTVDRLLDHDHFVLPALRLKCLQLTELFQLIYTYATVSEVKTIVMVQMSPWYKAPGTPATHLKSYDYV